MLFTFTNVIQKSSVGDNTSGVAWRVVNYNDIDDLAAALRGIHTVLSFVNQLVAGHDNDSQKNLIDGSIAAGVKRFAPSEYGRKVTSNLEAVTVSNPQCYSDGKGDLPFWAGKTVIKEHLEQVNANGKVNTKSHVLGARPHSNQCFPLGARVYPVSTRSILRLSRVPSQDGQIRDSTGHLHRLPE